MAESVQAACDAILADWVKPGEPGAAVAVMREGEPVYLGGYGLADLEQRTAVSTSTRFFVGSVSKQFCGACAALAIEDGLISLEDGVREYVPELGSFADAITIEHLLRHTSGLRDTHLLLVTSGWRDWDVMTHGDALERILLQRELNFAPGETWSYSNSGYVLSAEVLMRVTGKSLREFAHERLFEPLGMASTHFHDDPMEIVPGRAHGHLRDPGGGHRLADVWSGMVGTTGIFTTVEDFCRWDRNLRSGAGVGGERFVERMTSTGALNDGRPVDYGFGVFVTEFEGHRAIEHGGQHGGSVTHYIQLPDEGLSVVVCANCFSTPMIALASAIARRVLSGHPVRARLEPAGPLAIPPGVYRDRDSGCLTAIRRKGDGLAYGIGDRLHQGFEPLDYVGPAQPLTALDESGALAGIGDDDRQWLSYSPDDEELVFESLYSAVAKVFERVGEVPPDPGPPPTAVDGEELGSFGCAEMETVLRARRLGEWLAIEGPRFGPLYLEPAAGAFASAGLTVELEGNPARPAALVLRSDWMRRSRFERQDEAAAAGVGTAS